jgi:CRP-like cAMP-binding protein
MAEAALERDQYFSKFSDSFKDDLVKLMISFDVPEGHIFVEEGGPIHSFFIVESGVLVRTKRRYGDDEPILIDEVGPGIATGFLHVAGRDDDVAFATIAAGKGGARVWAVDGSQFRILCEENPQVSVVADWKVSTRIFHFSCSHCFISSDINRSG